MAIVTSKATKCGTDQIDDETRASFVRFSSLNTLQVRFYFVFQGARTKLYQIINPTTRTSELFGYVQYSK